MSVTFTGAAFDTGAQHASALLGTPVTGGILFCPLATVGTPSNTSLVATVPASLPAAGCYVEAASGARTASASGFSLATGLYLARVQHLGDVSSADYSGLIVTGPSYNPDVKGIAASKLNTARAAAGVVVATDDLGNAFLYAAGGTTTGSDRLASVEAAPIGLFGDLGGTCTVSGCSFRKLDRTPLPTARSGLSLVARTVPGDTSYLFAIGGSGVPSGGGAVAALPEVWRAQVLRNADAPQVTSLTSASLGTLGAGTYYYRVSALRLAGDAKNPAGETLASDEEPITVDDNSKVTIRWTCTSADKYRVYRTSDADQASGREVLAKAERQVKRGNARSVSAWVDAAMEEKARREDLATLLSEMRAENGAPNAEEQAWARAVLGL